MAVSKRTRFEVLRRDNFTCRYCRSTDNELTVDHVTPVALGYFSMGALALICVLIAERGQLFGVGAEYSHTDFSHHEAH